MKSSIPHATYSARKLRVDSCRLFFALVLTFAPLVSTAISALPAAARKQLDKWMDLGIQTDDDFYELDKFLGTFVTNGRNELTDRETFILAGAASAFMEKRKTTHVLPKTIASPSVISREWVAGSSHPKLTNIVASNETNKWVPAPGYRWNTLANDDMRVVWEPKMKARDNAGLETGREPGEWHPVEGDERAHSEGSKDTPAVPNGANSSPEQFGGIGAILAKSEKSADIFVKELIPDGPASAAGLREGDIIVAVNQGDISEKNVNDVVSLIRGPAGTRVSIHVRRDGHRQMTFDLIRATVNSSPSVKEKPSTPVPGAHNHQKME